MFMIFSISLGIIPSDDNVSHEALLSYRSHGFAVTVRKPLS